LADGATHLAVYKNYPVSKPVKCSKYEPYKEIPLNLFFTSLGKSGRFAVPSTRVTVGDQIEIIPGTDMGRFTSKSLKKTFDNIHFAAGIKGGKPNKDLPPLSHPALLLPQ